MNRTMKHWIDSMIHTGKKKALPILTFPSVGLLGIRRAASLLCLLHRVKNRGGLV